MNISVRWSDKMRRKPERFQDFVQKMANRQGFGELRYGLPDKTRKYFTRLKKEVKAYQKTGNMEHLINAANYCQLESEQPENKKFHFDAFVKSVTREKD